MISEMVTGAWREECWRGSADAESRRSSRRSRRDLTWRDRRSRSFPSLAIADRTRLILRGLAERAHQLISIPNAAVDIPYRILIVIARQTSSSRPKFVTPWYYQSKRYPVLVVQQWQIYFPIRRSLTTRNGIYLLKYQKALVYTYETSPGRQVMF